jgi:hypothetical protein
MWHSKLSRAGHVNIYHTATGRLLARNIPEREAAKLIAEHNQPANDNGGKRV